MYLEKMFASLEKRLRETKFGKRKLWNIVSGKGKIEGIEWGKSKVILNLGT